MPASVAQSEPAAWQPVAKPDTAVPIFQGIADTIALAEETIDTIAIQAAEADSAAAAISDSIAADMKESEAMDSAQVAAALARMRGSAGRIKRDKVDLDAQVKFSSSDSMIVIRRDSAMMYGTGQVEYGDLKLDASQIEMDLRDNTVYAFGVPDSTGEITGTPVFNEKGTDYEAKAMRYNFKTKKGILTNLITQQGEGYITGGTTKKDEEDNYYMKDSRYTTCDNHDCPHFYFQVTKGKMRPRKDVVVGPTYMVLAGLPLPIAVPFGFFPFTSDYSSGVILPTFGDDYQRGFYLSDGGYYFAISDNVDLALTGEIYTKGSWGLRAQSSYTKRYKYNGSFNVSYLKSIYGEKGSPDYSAQTNFQVL